VNEREENYCFLPFYLYKTTRTHGLYKIYIINDILYGAKIAGEIFDEESSYLALGGGRGILWYLLSPWIKNVIKNRYIIEKEYDNSEFEVTSFFNKNKANFVLNISEIKKVKIYTRRLEIAPDNRGTIVVEANKSMKFIAIGNKQNLRYIAEVFSKLEVPLEIKDEGIFYDKL
jgi:hypothetical protein